ncbi:alpha/beta fold hydrolase [Kribbella monticola]|uniref:alpha/beta fold hydrolase n=1 Tax=Kribbella monticola TaxID=2185285 RepID=UPI000DD3AE64|nr:alpha/beta hydrolase [Kribbella monticola]
MTSELLRLPDGRQAQYWSAGEGPVVFFLHGCPDTRHAAYPGAEAARDLGVRLIAVNRPGYGQSDACESDHLSVADDVASVADLLGVERYAVLGMSLGGPYALACAARRPDRVRAVAVVASTANVPELDPPYHRDDLTPDKQAFIRKLARCSISEAIELMRPEFESYVAQLDPRGSTTEALARKWIDGLHPLDVEVLARQDPAELAAAAREALANTAGYLRDAAISFRSWAFRPETITCPTTIWHGTEDPNASIRNAHWLAAQIPGATLELRPTAHLSTLHTLWPELLATLRGVDK